MTTCGAFYHYTEIKISSGFLEIEYLKLGLKIRSNCANVISRGWLSNISCYHIENSIPDSDVVSLDQWILHEQRWKWLLCLVRLSVTVCSSACWTVMSIARLYRLWTERTADYYVITELVKTVQKWHKMGITTASVQMPAFSTAFFVVLCFEFVVLPMFKACLN